MKGMKETILQIIPAYGWTALLAVKCRWPRRVRLERWPVVAWALTDYGGAQIVEPLIAVDTEGIGSLAVNYSNFVAVIGPGDRMRQKYRRLAREIVGRESAATAR